jgi:hypothetical protein
MMEVVLPGDTPCPSARGEEGGLMLSVLGQLTGCRPQVIASASTVWNTHEDLGNMYGIPSHMVAWCNAGHMYDVPCHVVAG